MKKTLFGHLSSKFTTSSENIATEALNFILGQSQPARIALTKFINNNVGINLDYDLSFSTQAGDKDAIIPDLVGKNVLGEEVFVVESKFWAGLTDNQPVNYLKRLPNEKEGVLLFVCPEKRNSTIWPELIRRCNNAQLEPQKKKHSSNTFSFVQINSKHYLALTSWRLILDLIKSALLLENDYERISDIEQLNGLCEQMDRDAFLPIKSKELSYGSGRRIMQFKALVDDVANQLSGEGIISFDGLKAASSFIFYRRYFTMKPFSGWLELNYSLWGKLRETPIWLCIKEIGDDGWDFSIKAHEQLRSLEHEFPKRLFLESDYLAIPIYLETNKERDEVIKMIYKQFIEVRDKLFEKK